MLIKKPSDIKAFEITDEKHFLSRRQFIKETSRFSLIGSYDNHDKWAVSVACTGSSGVDYFR